MADFKLTYGTSKLALSVPDAALLNPPIGPRAAGTMTPDEIRARICAALRHPVESRPLAEIVGGRATVVIVSDEFRAGMQRELLEITLAEIAACSPESVTVICATGTHDPKFYAGNIGKWTHEAARAAGLAVEFIAHDCDDPALLEVGVTPLGTPLAIEPAVLRAEALVYLHEAKVHYMNGYSLVDKQILPGVAARRSVEINHKRALDAENSIGGNSPHHADPARNRNPFGTDTRDARRLTEGRTLDAGGNIVVKKKCVFAVDVLSDADYVHAAYAGDPETVSAKMIEKIEDLTVFTVKRAEYVIVSPGGPPACDAIYGVQNCFDLALKGAIRRGGEALVIAPCAGRAGLAPDVSGIAPDAKSKKLFWDSLIELWPKPLAEAADWIERNFELYLWKTDRVLKLAKGDGIKIHLYSELDPRRLAGSPFVPVADAQAWIDERSGRGKFNVIDSGNKILVRGK